MTSTSAKTDRLVVIDECPTVCEEEFRAAERLSCSADVVVWHAPRAVAYVDECSGLITGYSLEKAEPQGGLP